MYAWVLVGHNTSEAAMVSGFGGDLSKIMREGEALLEKGRGFVFRIDEVVPRLSVFHLGAVHVPTGREWIARRDNRGGVFWQEHYRRVDPDVVYNLAATHDAGALA